MQNSKANYFRWRLLLVVIFVWQGQALAAPTVTREASYCTSQGVDEKAEPAFTFSVNSLDKPSMQDQAVQYQLQQFAAANSNGLPSNYQARFAANELAFHSDANDGISDEAFLALILGGQVIVCGLSAGPALAGLAGTSMLGMVGPLEKTIEHYEERHSGRLYVRLSDGGVRLTRYATPVNGTGAYIVRAIFSSGQPSYFLSYWAGSMVELFTHALVHLPVPLPLGELFLTKAEKEYREQQSHLDGETSMSSAYLDPHWGWVKGPDLRISTGTVPVLPAPQVNPAQGAPSAMVPMVPVQELLSVPVIAEPVRAEVQSLADQGVAKAQVTSPDAHTVVVIPETQNEPQAAANDSSHADIPKSVAFTSYTEISDFSFHH